ncbi:MAG TPA: LytR C-terminal domain-containing protein [Candidatus Eisenbacteria bacterium]|jgi:hypothetical protein
MAGRDNPLARLALAALALLVVALVLSWSYVSFFPRSPAPVSGTARRVIRVQVLNGTPEGGIAARTASYLRSGGFHVVEVKNAERSDYFATMVVARRADPSAARIVARYLGGPPVIQQAWSSDLAEVTVVLGSDRSQLHLED